MEKRHERRVRGGAYLRLDFRMVWGNAVSNEPGAQIVCSRSVFSAERRVAHLWGKGIRGERPRRPPPMMHDEIDERRHPVLRVTFK